MKYTVIAVLMSIVAGAAIYYFNQSGEPPQAEQRAGWMQR